MSLLVFATPAPTMVRGPQVATLTGRVVGTDQRSLSNVKVTAKGTYDMRTTFTDSTGSFELNGLFPGPFEVQVQASGYCTTTSKIVLGSTGSNVLNQVVMESAGRGCGSSSRNSTQVAPTPFKIQTLFTDGFVVAISHDGKSGAWAGAQDLYMFDPSSGSTTGAMTVQFSEKTTLVAINDDGDFVAAGGASTIFVWKKRSLHMRLTPEATAPFSLIESIGNLLATAEGSIVRIWDLEAKKVIFRIPHPTRIDRFQFLDEGQRIAVWSKGDLHLWNLR